MVNRIIVASEDLSAGDFINIFDNGGTPNVRRADASGANASQTAQGFVRVATQAGQEALVNFEGFNDRLSGLTPGACYALSHTTPGAVVELGVATRTAGQSLQTLGVAVAADTLEALIQQPIIRG